MVPAHFHDVDGELSDHNVGKIFRLSKTVTVILRHRALLVFGSVLIVICSCIFVLGSLAALIHLQIVQEL